MNSCDFIPKNNDAKEWLAAIPKLKTYIDEYQNGGNAKGQVKNEKMSQQSILNNINSSIDSDYYITDMEYNCPGIGYGRFDYVAINKKKGKAGKYGLALIELKYRTSAFGTSREEKNGKTSYGSGIVGHALNFSRFVYGVKNNNSFQREKVANTKYDKLEFLREETVNILRNKIDLGLLDIESNEMYGILDDENIDISKNNVETLLICVACEDEYKAKDTISKYLGFNNVAEENVEKLKTNGEIAHSFKLKCFITKEDTVESLYENQFTDLSI
ncbi:hypothetical protein [Clostridium magnum]|uniref:Uncharacterized protein n=1 Tax=Clostridium magnum DSM 2767 TaxID=1121326 RepID=A0A162R5Z2_9CLOT|nr:hypothetical protein [Clostridium magnum]KZL89481.1 hypothetical protein CLMAG_49700 [Clostridium magnum DSM 2767]SHJ30765.1 hypothetical protein SAMN02745944_05729 [Clostridium magnum DSM 2767]